MTSSDEPGHEHETTKTSKSSLTAALLRISASLDLETVLREVVESARTLTGASYAAIVTIDETGTPQDFVTAGFTEEEHRNLIEWADGPKLFEFFRDLQGPLLIPDVPSYVRSLGFSADRLPSKTLYGTSMRHGDAHVGNFYLVEKETGAAFTDWDEEVLRLFAAQAAAVIAHARAYRDELRARADIEALIETSPVGVAVFNATTGYPVSFNREARRMMESLRLPGRPAEELLQTITCRRADGREIALDRFSLASELRRAETVRAEEIALSAPDGRSITTLVNATPITDENGAVVSVVVTMQDLAPIQELERLRAEFIGMVSHELRAPLTSIKGSAATVLSTSRVLDPAEVRQFFRIIDEQANHMDGLIGDLLDAGRIDAGTLSVSPNPAEVTMLVDQARNTFLSSGGRHSVLIDLPPDLPQVLADRQRIVQVLNNLLANSAKYAPETSPIQITAVRDGTHVALSVSDEGRGVAPERLPFLFRKYAVEPGGAGGLGLAICKGLVEAHGGRIYAESGGIGMGTCVTFTIPVVEGAGGPAATPRAREQREGGETARILVVDDDPQTLRYVRDTLATAGYTTLVMGDYAELAHVLETEQPQLVLLDLVLPGIDGMTLMERVPALADRPVIFISGYGHDETVAQAFAAGAEDYIVKPFSPTELVARVRAALRRRAEPDPFVLGDLTIDYDRRLVRVDGQEVALTAIEYNLLRVLSLGAGRVVDYDALMRQVWKGRTYGEPKKLVRAFVKRLRQKLGDDAVNPAYIVTVRGVGYRMVRLGEA